jgi:bifunctional UDP-N-acetylglucosamine pyrophosphorylase/glucosamine-1-phosphate N-acetyltransferase
VVLGHDRDRITPAVAELADTLSRPIDVAVQEQQLGTGHAVGCGLAALPGDFAGTLVVTSGDIPLLDADTLAELIGTHSAETAGATVLTTTLADPTGYGRILRTQDSEVIGIVEQTDATGRSRPSRGQRRRTPSTSRCCVGAAAAAAKRPTGALPHRRHLDHPAGRSDGALLCRRRCTRGGHQRPVQPDLGAELNRRTRRPTNAGVTVVDPATTWIDVDDFVPHRHSARHAAARRRPNRGAAKSARHHPDR